MHRRYVVCLLIVSFCVLGLPSLIQAQGWGFVEGQITEARDGLPLPGATIIVAGTDFGTAAQEDGRYRLRIPVGVHRLRISAVGFTATFDSVTVRRDQTTRLDVALEESVAELDELTVTGDLMGADAGVYRIDPQTMRDMPTPLQDGLRALKVMPGVASNNELSNQYSVRGGGFNENLIFINGFEVFLPFRPRQGEQEGLSLLNADLAERVTFYSGGFPVRYGGKLSSALEVDYHRPRGAPPSGRVHLSTLDAGASVGASALDGRLGYVLGIRRAEPGRFFGTQDLDGTYEPSFTDVQTFISYELQPGHEVEFIGMLADHEFRLDPSGSRTFFGAINLNPGEGGGGGLQSLWRDYDPESEQRDGYQTQFAGLRVSNQLSDRLRIAHDVSFFGTEEREFFDLRSTAVLFQVDPSQPPLSDDGRIRTGQNQQEEFADNRIAVRTLTGQGRYNYTLGSRHALEGGWSLRQFFFDDRIDEGSTVEGVVDRDGTEGRIEVERLEDTATLTSTQGSAYAQGSFDVLQSAPSRWTATVGVRANYFSLNDEWTVSPRLSTRFQATDQLLLTGAWGIYHQPPTYRELRGKPEPGESILGTLNRDIASQRSNQFVLGGEYFLEQRRLYLRAEAYYKDLRNLISYDIDNVRVQYSGENDADGYAYGLDLQVRGEFVPGLESWVNYSYLKTDERFRPAFQNDRNSGAVPRPTDQRHTFSLFVQDYIPTDDDYRLHLRILFGSGLPYTPPVADDQRVGSTVVQVPGERHSARFIEYRRVDLGITRDLELANNLFGRPVTMHLTGELLNVFDMSNVISYAWFPDEDGTWQRVPTRLTPRTFNLRLSVDF